MINHDELQSVPVQKRQQDSLFNLISSDIGVTVSAPCAIIPTGEQLGHVNGTMKQKKATEGNKEIRQKRAARQ